MAVDIAATAAAAAGLEAATHATTGIERFVAASEINTALFQEGIATADHLKNVPITTPSTPVLLGTELKATLEGMGIATPEQLATMRPGQYVGAKPPAFNPAGKVDFDPHVPGVQSNSQANKAHHQGHAEQHHKAPHAKESGWAAAVADAKGKGITETLGKGLGDGASFTNSAKKSDPSKQNTR